MLFNSPVFIFLFLPLVLAGFWSIARWVSHQAAALWLALCSLFFYGWWDSRYVVLLLGSIAFNYGMGLCISRARATGHAAPVMWFAVVTNLLLLGYFKYLYFFIDTINQVAGSSLPLQQIVLPLGISFFTFTQIAFLVDVHRGIAREYNPIHYLLFVTWFPHLIAGPVLHHKEMMPQFAHRVTYTPQARAIALGLFLFSLGLFKKTVFADSIAPHSTEIFELADRGEPVTFLQAWQGALAYTLQLYFDFSGYVDMALGCSKMFGIDLPVNFNSPYQAVNINDFWRRWHMTLGRFFRDYVYIPLGGNRKGLHRAQANIVVVMLLSGLWHGAGWTFIIWGGLHALMAVANHYWRAFRQQVLRHDLTQSTWPGRLLAMLVTFVCVVFCWVFFRAETVAGALVMVQAMLSPTAGALQAMTEASTVWQMIAAMLLVVWCLPNSCQMARGEGRWVWRPEGIWLWWAILCMVIGSTVMLYGDNRVNEFLYFNF